MAFYSQEEKALKFFYFPSKQNKNKTVYTARSYDVVGHEGRSKLIFLARQ